MTPHAPTLRRLLSSLALAAGLAVLPASAEPAADSPAAAPQPGVRYGTQEVDGLDVFFREAGNPADPTIVLLHGFPSSSHMYREVLDGLGAGVHVIAPDYPGFGDSSDPAEGGYEWTFDRLAETMDAFLEARGIECYALMIHDYGAPVGFRIALAHPERVRGLVVMNGNAYEEGIGPAGWGPVLDYWKGKTPELEATIKENVFGIDGLRWQYTHGTRNPDGINPDNWNLDFGKLSRPGQHRKQLDLFFDYQNNLKRYPDWQAYLRDRQPPVLLLWGRNDAFFPPAGAEAFKRDVPDLEFHLLDTGHFPLEEEAPFILGRMRAFLADLPD